jgi:hypothetical protein
MKRKILILSLALSIVFTPFIHNVQAEAALKLEPNPNFHGKTKLRLIEQEIVPKTKGFNPNIYKLTRSASVYTTLLTLSGDTSTTGPKTVVVTQDQYDAMKANLDAAGVDYNLVVAYDPINIAANKYQMWLDHTKTGFDNIIDYVKNYMNPLFDTSKTLYHTSANGQYDLAVYRYDYNDHVPHTIIKVREYRYQNSWRLLIMWSDPSQPTWTWNIHEIGVADKYGVSSKSWVSSGSTYDFSITKINESLSDESCDCSYNLHTFVPPTQFTEHGSLSSPYTETETDHIYPGVVEVDGKTYWDIARPNPNYDPAIEDPLTNPQIITDYYPTIQEGLDTAGDPIITAQSDFVPQGTSGGGSTPPSGSTPVSFDPTSSDFILRPFFDLLRAILFYLLRLADFIITLPLIPTLPIENEAFQWVRNGKFMGVYIYNAVLNMATLFMSLAVYKVIRRIF